MRSTLADNSQIELEIYLLTVVWDGKERQVDVLGDKVRMAKAMGICFGD